MTLTALFSTDSRGYQLPNVLDFSSDLAFQKIPNPLTSVSNSGTWKFSALDSTKVVSFPSRSTLLKTAKIIAGVLVISVAAAAVVALCLKFLPVLILALTIAGLVCMLKQNLRVKKLDQIAYAVKLIEKEQSPEEDEFESVSIPGLVQRKELHGGRPITAFSSFSGEEHDAYPYEVKDANSKIPDEIFKHFATQVVGESKDGKTVEELFRECLQEGHPKQNQAKQISAFLMLLGNRNQSKMSQDDIFKLCRVGVALCSKPLQPGRLTVKCAKETIGKESLSYTVDDEIVGLYQLKDIDLVSRPGAGKKPEPVARFKTSRTVVVSPPDTEGNVKYTITRTFTKI